MPYPLPSDTPPPRSFFCEHIIKPELDAVMNKHELPLEDWIMSGDNAVVFHGSLEAATRVTTVRREGVGMAGQWLTGAPCSPTRRGAGPRPSDLNLALLPCRPNWRARSRSAMHFCSTRHGPL